MQFYIKLLLQLALIFFVSTATAAETLESILERAAAQQNVAIDYREVRHLQMLNEPWQAEGKMIVTASAFVIDQLAPQRQLLTANKHRYWLYMPEAEIRRTGMVTSPMAQRSFGLFKPIMNGDRDALEKEFDIHFTATDKRWLLELKPKRTGRALYARITVQGEDGHPASYMKTEMVDGDFTEWFFQQQPFTSSEESSVKRLMDEARGN
ncbi:MAG: hypothetical protein AUJ57_03175 [Zetaproteobacteria bacterium CG1_02_53_45]|nr:MAG: hypothetical protein AUJ57_03175 [Zetaproteobacteria bacterium CG1_02_53_45]